MGDRGWASERLIAPARAPVRRTPLRHPAGRGGRAQEALIILYREIGTRHDTAALAAWMFRIVRNECQHQQHAGRQDQLPQVELTTHPARDGA